MSSIQNFKGVIPAVLSVFDKDENLDEQSTREYIRYLLSYDIGGLYLTGSTGEFVMQNSAERCRQVDIVMDEVNGKVPVVVHVGAIGTKESIALAKYAESAGADGISSVPPFYFKFNEEQIFNYYKDIAESTSLPFIVYNFPLAGMMSVNLIERLSRIDNVMGVKYTGTALYEETLFMDKCKPGFMVYGGCDEMGSSNISLGVHGIIGSFYNCIPDLYIKIWKAVKANDIVEAARLQRQAVHVIMQGLESGSMIACIKTWLRAAGVPAGYARRPFNNFTAEKEEQLVNSLIELDQREEIHLDIVQRITQIA